MKEKGEVQAVARTLGLEVVPFEIRRAEDIASAFDAFKGQADALYVTETSLIFANGKTHHHACAQRAAADDLLTRKP